jgi:two-component SAPR family response regulator
MAPMSGIEFAGVIHDIDPKIPIMLITAYDRSTFDLPPFLNEKDIITKPFSGKNLSDRIRNRLRNNVDSNAAVS